VGSFVSATREGDAVRVVECLAVAGTARAAVFEIAVKSGLDPRFPPAVMREVSSAREEPRGDLGVSQAELFHLCLQALARDLQPARRVRDVALGLVQGAQDELALEP